MKDFGKSREGRAGLPQEAYGKEYPKVKTGSAEDYDDTMEGIDAISKQADSKQKKYKSNQK